MVPAARGAPPPHRLFVFGDSFAVGTRPYLPRDLRGWRVEQDTFPNRGVDEAAPVLRRQGASLAPVVHLSLGTVDDPDHPERFRAGLRRAMRAVGTRCVVWPNIFRPVVEGQGWDVINAVLAQEAARRRNLIVVDWAGLVARHLDWLSPADATHVSERGYRARARAVAGAVRECYRRLG